MDLNIIGNGANMDRVGMGVSCISWGWGGFLTFCFHQKALYEHVVSGLACCCVPVHACTHTAEREYDTSYFHNQVQRVLIDDHNVPKFT